MKLPTSTRLVSVLCAGLLCTACATKGPGPLYMWEAFPTHQYKALLREGASPEEQIRLMQAHAEKAKAANASLPPGFRAHLGLLYLNTGDAGEAKRLWEAEKAAFPESTPFMDSLLKKLTVTGIQINIGRLA